MVWKNLDIKEARVTLPEIARILDTIKARFWIAKGTALGIFRDGALIKTDNDIDLHMMAEDWNKKVKMALQSKGYNVEERGFQGNLICYAALTKKGRTETHIQLLYYYSSEDACLIPFGNPDDHETLFPARFFRGDKFITFNHTRYRIPNPPEDYLQQVYDNWRVVVKRRWYKGRKYLDISKYVKWIIKHRVPLVDPFPPTRRTDSWLNFATIFINKKTGKKSRNFIEVLPRSLTLDPGYTTPYLWNGYNTLFSEVKIVPPLEAITKEARSIFTTETGTLKLSHKQFYVMLKHKLMDIIFANWDPEKFHVHLHSSGLDSRMFSWAVKRLVEKYGETWLGDVMFLCSKWEGSEFKKIMQYEGWSPGQYLVVDEELSADEYYESSLLNFDHAWIENNGPAAIPVNLMWYLVERSQAKNILPQHIQLWTTQWGNTIMEPGSGAGGGEAIRNQFIRHYLSTIGTSPKKGDEVIDIYTQVDYAKLIVESSIRLGKSLRPELLRSMDPGLLNFKNIHASGDRKRPIADWIREKMIEDYRASWYGRNVAPDIIWERTTKDAVCWSRWTCASLCEYLLNNGYKIRKKR